MALTPETLPRHELNGLCVTVVAAANPDLVGIAGRVVLETMNTLHVDTSSAGASRVKRVPKQGSVFEFALTDEAADRSGRRPEPRRASRDAGQKGSGTASKRSAETAGHAPGQSSESAAPAAARRHSGDGEGAAYVTVDGARLLSRPAERTETTGDSPWR